MQTQNSYAKMHAPACFRLGGNINDNEVSQQHRGRKRKIISKSCPVVTHHQNKPSRLSSYVLVGLVSFDAHKRLFPP